ncbi:MULTISPECIES: RagB/SusD family nutrient uptake outer membrane protein [unclassified Myroides]|uniref:RagB/SusD family nutrient uptake outer membrane protein n=1 Tax=unclassified Myroides TaxID=2642485 RepID=UPI003100DED1
MKNILLNSKKLILLLTIVVFIQACEKYIDTSLPSNQINSPEVFNDIATVKAALSSIYTNARSSSIISGGVLGMGLNLGVFTDDLECYFPQSNNTGIYDLYTNNLLASNNSISKLWNNSYNHIYSINLFIESLTKSTNITSKQKEVYLGEAYFLRALYYHYLVQIFGNIPYTTSTNYNYNSNISKSSFDQILIKIEEDLKLAIDLLPLEYRGNDRIYPNAVTAELLLSKNYLLQKQYDKAEFYAMRTISNPIYTLEYDINKVFKKDAKSTLWQLKTSLDGEITEESRTYLFNQGPPTNFSLTEDLIKSFNTNDLRLNNWIREIKSDNQYWYHAYKYKNTSGQNKDEYSIIFRIEEAYFICGEALIKQKKIEEAKYFINEIKRRANTALLHNQLNQEELTDELLKELRREFFTEQGHRFFDLKRNAKLNALQSLKPNWTDKHQLFPYPEKETILNQNLLPQNYGY